ncbi:aldehyde dehydrogenase family protein [Frankia nepalensis]|nr:aldehyde dehydrogenase family protein [Frankia nepalensis]
MREFPPIREEAVDHAIREAHQAFQSWRGTSVDERAALVGRAAQLMRERIEHLARLATLEMGKIIRHSRVEIDLSARILQYYADKAPVLLADEPLDFKDGSAVIASDPLGVILGVQPWNFPVYQTVRFAAPNLVLGNTVLLKPASNTPQSALPARR